MKRILLTLALCCVVTRVGLTADDDKKQAAAAAQKTLLELLPKNGGADVIKPGEMLAKKHQLEPVMVGFKRKDKGGIGLGTNLGKAEPKQDFDSIELLLKRYDKKGPNKDEVKNNADDLVRMGQISAIIAEVSRANTPKKDGPGKQKIAEWKRLTEEMQQSSAELIAAAKAKDEKAVTAAAKRLNASCVDCHGIFRVDQ